MAEQLTLELTLQRRVRVALMTLELTLQELELVEELTLQRLELAELTLELTLKLELLELHELILQRHLEMTLERLKADLTFEHVKHVKAVELLHELPLKHVQLLCGVACCSTPQWPACPSCQRAQRPHSDLQAPWTCLAALQLQGRFFGMCSTLIILV